MTRQPQARHHCACQTGDSYHVYTNIWGWRGQRSSFLHSPFDIVCPVGHASQADCRAGRLQINLVPCSSARNRTALQNRHAPLSLRSTSMHQKHPFLLAQHSQNCLRGFHQRSTNGTMNMPEPDRIIRLKTVLHRSGLSRSTVYRKMEEGTFPPRIKLGMSSAGWKESELNRRIAAPPRYGAPSPRNNPEFV